MRLLSEVLVDLLGFAEDVVTRPARHVGSKEDERFAILAGEVRHADARPAEGERATDGAMVMIRALEKFFAGDREPTSYFLGHAGVTLVWLRGDAWQALRNEKEARGS